MSIIQSSQTYIDETADPGLLLTKIALAKQDGGIVVFQTPQDIYVTAVEERVTYQQVNNIVNDVGGNLKGEIQFGNNGKFDADKDFRYDPDTDILTLTGSVHTGNIVVTRHADFGAIGNITIDGGLAGQFLSTDGTGSLSWQTPLPVTPLPIANGTSQLDIPVADGQITITASGSKTWAFNTNGYLALPNISTGVGLDEQTQYASQRKIIPAGRSSVRVPASNTPTVVYTVSSSTIVAFKTELAIQHASGDFEFINVTASRSGTTVGYTVTNQIAPPSVPNSTLIVDIDGSGRLQITLTTLASPSATAGVTYDATEFGRPTA